MTKYKEYLRSRNIPLECDFPILPCDELQSISTKITDLGIVITYVYSSCTMSHLIGRYGDMCNG